MASGLVRGTRELKNKNVVVNDAGPSHDPQKLKNYNYYGTQTQFGGRFIHEGTYGRESQWNVYGHRDEGRLSGGIANKGPILPDVVVGARMERNMRRSLDYEVGSTRGAGRKTKHQARDPIPEDELSILLRRLNVMEEETDVQFDDETVFCTFSKGYPVTESKVQLGLLQ